MERGRDRENLDEMGVERDQETWQKVVLNQSTDKRRIIGLHAPTSQFTNCCVPSLVSLFLSLSC